MKVRFVGAVFALAIAGSTIAFAEDAISTNLIATKNLVRVSQKGERFAWEFIGAHPALTIVTDFGAFPLFPGRQRPTQFLAWGGAKVTMIVGQLLVAVPLHRLFLLTGKGELKPDYFLAEADASPASIPVCGTHLLDVCDATVTEAFTMDPKHTTYSVSLTEIGSFPVGSIHVGGDTPPVSSVPEPLSLLLMGIGILGVAHFGPQKWHSGRCRLGRAANPWRDTALLK
jgi:hypothetical protein